MTKLSFIIESDAPYSDEEIADLKEAFVSFMGNVDDEINDESAVVCVVNPDENKAEQEKIREVAAQLISDGIVSVKVELFDADGDDIRSVSLSTES